QDHPMTTITFVCTEKLGLFDATNPRYLLEYVALRGRGKLTSNVGEAGAHVRTRDDLPAPDFQILFRAAYYFDNGFRTFPGDDHLEAWIRAEAQHEYHPSCTCRIGPDGEGVVDEQLRVRGVEGLRVADASVFPRIPGGNTNAPTIMVGERAADLVLGRVPAPAVAAAT